ncbi:uncharacterized protein LOC113306071 [Papaver somniferum]|uniref:uncharacterized protein LOC113306071 n=1 Tax=Papaver somniferum TaxID=3469 RepID=UPI000E705B73|nr:uncharacterized protein LOC113306071 [Papaver somniferum]
MDTNQVVVVQGDIQLQSLIGFVILMNNEDIYLNVDVIPKNTSRSNSGCSTSSGSSTANSCFEEDDYGWRIHFGPVNGDISRFVLKDSNVIHRFTLWCTLLVVGFLGGTLWCILHILACCGVGLRLKSPAVTTKLVKHLITDNIQGDPTLKPRQIMSPFKKTYGSNIKYHHARRGKEAVFEKQFGDDEKSYLNLTWYVKTIEQTNHDSLVKFEVDQETRRFQRIFIFFGACKHGYRYLRPMIYLDATFLTGRFRGTLMVATCINGNDGLYPFAFALVSAENKDNWFWFLDNLKQVVDRRPIFFLRDRHEGLSQGIPKSFPDSYHSYCFYHIKYNLPIGSGDANFKVLTLKKICGECMQLDKYLRTIPNEKWENAFFPICRYVAHSSTLSESFNNWIFEFKKLSTFALLDAIRLNVMKKNSERMVEGLENFNTRLTPVYEAILKENIDIGRTWTVVESMERLYEVKSPRSHSVDLLERTCTCHRWRVNGFPCAHACAAIQATREDIYSFVDPYFNTEWYNNTYQEIILPIPNYDKPQYYDPSDRVIVPIPVPLPGRRRAQHFKNTLGEEKEAYDVHKVLQLWSPQQSYMSHDLMLFSMFGFYFW